jgi:hypothetical protein
MLPLNDYIASGDPEFDKSRFKIAQIVDMGIKAIDAKIEKHRIHGNRIPQMQVRAELMESLAGLRRAALEVAKSTDTTLLATKQLENQTIVTSLLSDAIGNFIYEKGVSVHLRKSDGLWLVLMLKANQLNVTVNEENLSNEIKLLVDGTDETQTWLIVDSAKDYYHALVKAFQYCINNIH